MSNVIARYARIERAEKARRDAYQLLHWGFVAAPVLAGVDKFTGLLADWEEYLAPPIAERLGRKRHDFMRLVGAIEVGAGLLVAVRPRIGGWVVAGWLCGITANLVLGRRHLDVALRDFGLMLGALALARLGRAAQLTKK